jgi:hypothetical protein
MNSWSAKRAITDGKAECRAVPTLLSRCHQFPSATFRADVMKAGRYRGGAPFHNSYATSCGARRLSSAVRYSSRQSGAQNARRWYTMKSCIPESSSLSQIAHTTIISLPRPSFVSECRGCGSSLHVRGVHVDFVLPRTSAVDACGQRQFSCGRWRGREFVDHCAPLLHRGRRMRQHGVITECVVF